VIPRSCVRVFSLGLGVVCLLVMLGACGSDAGNAVFGASDGGDEGANYVPPGFFGDDASTGVDPDPDAACVGDACTITPTWVCGDKKIDAPENCDDGNAIPGDGCSGLCQIEPGYTCPTPGEGCIYTVHVLCGNGKIEGNEACDDGNKADGDGCSAGCQVEPGYTCTTPGQPCTPGSVAACGDGKVDFGESCDDGNKIANDGCSATCTIELGFTCPTPGKPCTKLEYCGDGIRQSATEACDDGNAIPGDGCSGVCKLEPGYACPAQGQPCVLIWVCGNGKVDPGEACDDSNTKGGDGCSADCTLVEPGYTCPNVNGSGGPCTKAPDNVCGDGIIAGTEQCDDGNKNSSDGCSANCAVEAGYTCPTAGKACTKIAFCGDGKVDLVLGEECDDKNTTPGDGCTAQCKLEPNFVCPTPGQPCVSTVVCGDKKVTGTETCDDGGKVSGDGCSSTCQIEKGWKCPVVGIPCVPAACGDGLKVGDEECDDGNTTNNDGCSATCRLQSKTTVNNGNNTTPPSTTITHYDCSYPNPAPNPTHQVCTPTVCGNGPAPDSPEGSEQCDDGNVRAYDGCSPSCTIEPKCPDGTCVARCGDGLLFNFDGNGDGKIDEACDDGNTKDGDGCSSTCQVEQGYACTNSAGTFPTFIDIPVVFRDFKYKASAGGHPDFESYGCDVISTDLVKFNLSAGLNGVPVFNKKDGTTGCTNQLTSATDLTDWYKDIQIGGVNRSKRIDGKQLRLQRTGTAGNYSYVFDSANDQPWATLGGFFPIDGLGWGNENGDAHNFAFTTELRYWFTYDKATSPTLTFSGDDDVWVFINGKLALDVGGLHPRQDAQFTLDNGLATTLGLVDGHLYEIALFHAERHTTESNFKLTLRGFVKNTSVCTNICGDGFRTREEQCDNGANNKPPASVPYGGCTTACKLGPYCGDNITTNPPETCDDGVNQSTYGGLSKKCGPGCKIAPYCGDGVVSNGEGCDDGTANNTGAYGKCSASCTLGPRCGDGILNGNEQCDHGISNGSSGDTCNANCTLKCGDGIKQANEQCDNGAANNTGGYGKCNPNCTLGPRCGDGLPNGTEQCDDGKNDGSYGTCKPNCTLANYCGDNILTNPPEVCDKGPANSATAYGPNLCSNRCTPAPRCGDKAVDGQFGEVCDDGVNSGQPGSCTTNCKGFVPLASCGNGVVNAPEQCDDGANNGTANSKCDTHCRFKCGNGFKDPGETCDNGINDGSYGGCTTNCQIAAYCGDGIKNGNEQCDNGASNVAVATAYGPGICTTACTFAPYCGDGRVQSTFGEECDSTASCSAACKSTGPK
jgi:fibro-slime domain-containing protein